MDNSSSQKLAIVVGVTGMDGEAAAYFLLSKGYKVIGTYRKNTFVKPNEIYLKYNNLDFHLEYCDIDDFHSVKSLISTVLLAYGKINEVYLLAAQSHVGNSFASPMASVNTNGNSAFNFLENLRNLSITTKLYFAGTSELLGGDPANCPFDETSPYECRSPYAIGKELGTRWVKYYNQTYNMFATYGILFNHSNVSRGLNFYIRRVTNGAARIALGKQDKLSLGCLDFYRDEHYADFGVEMMWKMLQLEKPETFLICRGEAFHGEQFLDEAFGYFNLDWRKYVTFDPQKLRPNEVVKLVGNPAKAVEKLGWRPNRISFQDHIVLMCDYDLGLEKGEAPIRPNVFELYP